MGKHVADHRKVFRFSFGYLRHKIVVLYIAILQRLRSW